MKNISKWDKHWLKIRLVIIFGLTIIIILFLHDTLFIKETNQTDPQFTTWSTLIIEIAIGIGITLVVHNHTRKTQERENTDLELTITGTYHILWNLYMSSKSYIKSQAVRDDKIPGLQIASMINSILMNLPKCGQKIKSDNIEALQLHLILMQNVIRASIDPRANSEEYWKKNSESFIIAVKELHEISSDFETFIPDSSKMVWSEEDA